MTDPAYRVAFSVQYQLGLEPSWVALHTEPIHHLNFSRFVAVTLRRRGFESVYVEELEDGIWKERKEERILIDGRP